MFDNNYHLEGRLVILREINETDFETIIAWRNDSDNNRFLNQPYQLTLQLQQEWYSKKYLPSSDILFMFLTKRNNKRFGMIGLNDYCPEQKIGIAGRLLIGEKAYRSSPEMLEANLLFYDFLFYKIKLKQVFCHIVKQNTKAIALDKRLGFRPNQSAAVFPEYLNVNGLEQVEMIMTKQSYENCKAKLIPMLEHFITENNAS
jgi:RimJ/RimL family protein N-acetyltransferase